ncbi:MAG TPA: 2-isopropylmalate synthase [Candidatus Binataceae bacterium]|nr:2-isopropylmalate synthase [Candidatus Binataceae bacterium]
MPTAKTVNDVRDILPDPNYVRIFDTTLRDGEQSPGCTMNVEEKLAIARQLERLGVDIIEAGFAASSPGDFESVHRIADAVTRPTVVSLSRTREEDVDAALRAVDKARNPGIHIFIATSDIHLKYKLNMTREDVLDAATWAVARARQHLDYIEFSCEDASRSDWEYMAKVCAEVIRRGARIINLPDTTGHAIPEEFGEMFAYMRRNVEGAERVIWSAHCHNDLGLAVANSLAAIKNGARQVECTINGIGERAGNTSMEEVVMALRTRQDLMSVRTGIDTRQIYPASRLLAQIIGQPVPPNKPIVGDNAFAHEAGIHQDGVLKYKLTYEIMKPEDIGIPSNKLVLGKHSGRHAFTRRLVDLGVDPALIDVNKAFAAFKVLCDKKKIVYDDDILALVNEETRRVADHFELIDVRVSSSAKTTPHAQVTMRVGGGEERVAEASGDGMVDACYKAIYKLAGMQPALERYSVKAITGGTDALGEVSCLVRSDGMTVAGQGAHSDIVMASALALVNALNRLKGRESSPVLRSAEGM